MHHRGHTLSAEAIGGVVCVLAARHHTHHKGHTRTALSAGWRDAAGGAGQARTPTSAKSPFGEIAMPTGEMTSVLTVEVVAVARVMWRTRLLLESCEDVHRRGTLTRSKANGAAGGGAGVENYLQVRHAPQRRRRCHSGRLQCRKDS